jgi:hypothetical protein
MRLVKLAGFAFIAIVLGSALSGCVIAPVPFGYGYGHPGYYHYHR